MHSLSESLLVVTQPHEQQRAALSPDGRWFAGVTHTTGESRRRGAGKRWEAASVRVFDMHRGGSTVLVPGAASWSPRWNRTGDRLAFLADLGDDVGLWTWRPGSQPSRVGAVKVAGAGFGDDAPQWFPDGRRVLIHAPAEVVQLPVDSEPTVDVLTNSPPAIGPSAQSRRRYFAVVDVETGDVQWLASGGEYELAVLSPEGTHLALQTPAVWTDPRVAEESCTVAVGTVDDRMVATPVSTNLRYSPNDGRHLPAWSSDGQRLAVVERNAVALWSTGGQVQRIDAPCPLSALLAVWSCDEMHLVVGDQEDRLWALAISDQSWVGLDAHRVRPIGSNAHGTFVVTDDDCLLVLERSGKLQRVPLDGGSAMEMWSTPDPVAICDYSPIWGSVGDATPDGRSLVFRRNSSTRPASYSTMAGPPLEDLNPHLGEAGAARRLAYTSSRGAELGLHVLEPAHGTPPYPTVIVVYPGACPSGSSPSWGTWNIGAIHGYPLSQAGYAIARADLPLGRAGFAQDADGTVDVLEAAADALVRSGIADEHRLVLSGWSGGGHAVSLAMTGTTRFRAAIAGAGDTNLTSAFGALRIVAQDTASMRGAMAVRYAGGAPPWEENDLIERSPVFRADRILTPMLLIHGSDDEAVPVGQSDELYVALRYLGRDVTYLRYRDENHSPHEFILENRMHLVKQVMAWLHDRLVL